MAFQDGFFFHFCVKRPKKCEEGKKLSDISDSEIYRNELDWTHGFKERLPPTEAFSTVRESNLD